MTNEIHCADCLEFFPKLVDDSIDLVCTSPPYFLNKDYEKDWTWDYFKRLMQGVFFHANRVLKPGGYFVVNFGDAYNSGGRFYKCDVPSVYPMTVFYFELGKDDFDLQSTRIWRKQFARMSVPFVCNSHPRAVFDYEHVWAFRKRGGPEEVVRNRKLSQRGVLGEDWGSSANLSAHCAAFPVELPLWAIDVYSDEGDTVLDPFTGSGTTAVAAALRKRKFIGCEKDLSHHKYAISRVLAITQSIVEFE